MRYEEPIMDIIHLEETCIVATSSIQEGNFGEVNKGYEDIPGEEF